MLRCYLLISVGCLIAAPNIAMAVGIGVKGGDPTCGQTSDVNLTGVNQTVEPDGFSGITCFIVTNNTSAIVTSLNFDMTINTGLTQDGLNVVGPGGIFSISQIGGAGYFLNTALTYNTNTGDLNFDFSGVNKPDQDEQCPHPDCEINEQEGIPPGGVFTIELSGWVDNLSVNDPINIYKNLPDVTTTFSPEPSTVFSLIVGLLLLVGVVEFRRRRSSASSRS